MKLKNAGLKRMRNASKLQQMSNVDLTPQKGFSLLELIFALAVAALIIVTATSRYQQSQWDQNLAVTQRSVQTVLQALNNYFYQYCNSDKYATELPGVTIARLNLSPVLIVNPFGQPFAVKIAEIANAKDKPIYQLQMTARYLSASMANTLRQQLGADAEVATGDKQTLTWSRLPLLAIADSSSAYWIQSDAFNQGATEGLRVYQQQNPGKVFIGVCNNRGPKP